MDKDIVQAINYFTFLRFNKLFGTANFAISVYDNVKNLSDYLDDIKKMGLGHVLIYGYYINNDKPKEVLVSFVGTHKKDKYWTKKNIGKLEQKYGHKFFIYVDKNKDSWLIDCRNDDITSFGEKYLGNFCAETMENLCPNTVFTDLAPYSLFSAYRFRDRKIKFSQDDSLEVFEEKLKQKYKEIGDNLKKKVVKTIMNIAQNKIMENKK